jgi:hypothetical protein
MYIFASVLFRDQKCRKVHFVGVSKLKYCDVFLALGWHVKHI